MRATSWVLCVVVFSGCGGPGSFAGKVGGHALEVRDALFFPLAGAPDGTAVRLVLGDREGLCQSLASSQEAPLSSGLVLTLFKVDGAGGAVPLATGEYRGSTTVQAEGGYAFGAFRRTDEACEQVLEPANAEVVGGRVSLDRLELGETGRLVGSFDLTFGAQSERASGSFDAKACPITALPPSPVCL